MFGLKRQSDFCVIICCAGFPPAQQILCYACGAGSKSDIKIRLQNYGLEFKRFMDLSPLLEEGVISRLK